MTEYIDRETLISEYDKAVKWLKENSHNMSEQDYIERMAAMQTGITMTESIPVADVAPVRHGRWIPTHDADKLRCSCCDVIHLIAQYPHGEINYCPNCGAIMDKDGDA